MLCVFILLNYHFSLNTGNHLNQVKKKTYFLIFNGFCRIRIWILDPAQLSIRIRIQGNDTNPDPQHCLGVSVPIYVPVSYHILLTYVQLIKNDSTECIEVKKITHKIQHLNFEIPGTTVPVLDNFLSLFHIKMGHEPDVGY